MTRHTAPKISNTKLVFDYGHRSDYETTMNSSYTKKQHIKLAKATTPHITELAPFGVYHKDAKVGLTTARPNYHHRLTLAKGAIPGNDSNAISHEQQAPPNLAQFTNKIVAPSTGGRLIHTMNMESEVGKHQPLRTSKQIVKPSDVEEDYADYVYPDDLARYKFTQLEAEIDEIHPRPPVPASIKPKPFHGIRKPARHTPKATRFEPAKPALIQKTDYDIISHLPRPPVKAPAFKPPKLGATAVSHEQNDDSPKDFRRKITILLPSNEQYKRLGTRRFMDEN